MLDAGTYATEGMSPALTYTVPSAGWASLNRTAAPGNFHLFPPGGSMSGFNEGTTDAITVLSAVTPPGVCNGLPSEDFLGTFRGVIDFVTGKTNLVVSNLGNATVSGLDGKVMDIAFGESDGCPDGGYADLLVGVEPSHGAVGVTSQTGTLRLYVLRLPGSDHPLAILVDDAKDGGSEYGDGEDWLAVADGVIDSFVIGTTVITH